MKAWTGGKGHLPAERKRQTMGKIQNIGQAASWRPFAMAGTLLVISAASALGMNTLAQAQEASQPAASAPGVPPHHHRFGPGSGGPGGPGFIPLGGRGLDHLLKEAKATDAQSTQIKALAKTAEADLKTLRESGRGLHEQTLALFAQPQVDAAAAENLRQQGLAQHDAASKRLLQFALDVSKILTPEQRADLVAKVQKRHERFLAHGPAHPRPEH
jgi:Spy/CpxP family protein refolding chaperone